MADILAGSVRTQITEDELVHLQETGALVLSDRRRRSRYFDGRFLTARDLTRDQSYFLGRQAALGRAAGMGVINGLEVSQADGGGSRIQVAAGLGLTPSGETVILDEALNLDLADVPKQTQLDVAFGLRPLNGAAEPAASNWMGGAPAANGLETTLGAVPQRQRSGLYVLALRPVEYTANPTTATYPTDLADSASVVDGDIVEAVAVTLIPYDEGSMGMEPGRRRAQAAHRIFVQKMGNELPFNALPLAMVALDHNIVQWIDLFMVRREFDAARGSVLRREEALRAAHLHQYEAHLAEVLLSTAGQPVTAADHFLALPPVGRLPKASVDSTNFTQTYFPPGMAVSLSFVAQDEIPALISECRALPPIDLSLDDGQHAGVSLVVLASVERATLSTWSIRPLPSSAMAASRTSLDPLGLLPEVRSLHDDESSPAGSDDSPWCEALASAGQLWYARRPALPQADQAAAAPITIQSASEEQVKIQLAEHQLTGRFDDLPVRGSNHAEAVLTALLSAPSMGQSKTVMLAALTELESACAGNTMDADVIYKVAPRYMNPQMGQGIAELQIVNPALSEHTLSEWLGLSGMLPEVDALVGNIKKVAEEEAVTYDGVNILATSLERYASSNRPMNSFFTAFEQLHAYRLLGAYDALPHPGPAADDAEIAAFLATHVLKRSRTVMLGAIYELSDALTGSSEDQPTDPGQGGPGHPPATDPGQGEGGPADPGEKVTATVEDVMDRYNEENHPELGLGIQALEALKPELTKDSVQHLLGLSRLVPEVDAQVRRAIDQPSWADLHEFAHGLTAILTQLDGQVEVSAEEVHDAVSAKFPQE